MTTAYEPGTVPQFERHDRASKAIDVANVTRAEIAEYVGVRPETLSRYLNGRTAMPVAIVRLIALRTGVPYAWIENGEAPSPDGDGASIVRHQGLEPRTRWFEASAGQDAAVIEFRRAS